MNDFLKKLLSDNSGVSSKRVAGLLGWIAFIAVTVILNCSDITVEDTKTDLLNTLAYTSTILIGGGTVASIFNKKQNIQ